MQNVVDMQRGVYRRIYSGATRGERINKLTGDQERLFWRLHMVCDDFGNFRADGILLKADALPLVRNATPAKITRWLQAIADVGLIDLYEADGDRCGHICDFEELQPMGYDGNRNAKRRIQRCPMHPLRSVTKENEGYEEKRPDTDTDTESDTEVDTDTETESGTNENELKASSDSDSQTKPINRAVAWLKYTEAVAPLHGSNGRGKGKYPPGSAQHEGDITSTGNWFKRRIWPECDPDDDACRERYHEFMSWLDAARGKEKPIAWLTSRVNKWPERTEAA